LKSRETIGKGAALISDGALKYVVFDCFGRYDAGLVHCMSTRLGGVSRDECSALNLGFNRRDAEENVKANFKRICTSIGIDAESLVFSSQVHGTCLRIVTEADRGKGFSKESDIRDVDGLLTDRRGVTLVTFYADCVPLFFLEPERKAIALVHSGWRGTYNNIAGEAVKKMVSGFGCNAGRIIAAIGPSIGSCCFEVEGDVFGLFAEKYPAPEFYTPSGPGKWKVDLQAIIRSELFSAGLDGENIHDSEICTRCRRDLFFSHRGDRGATGSLAAFMQLR
jgi:YfiH family protein